MEIIFEEIYRPGNFQFIKVINMYIHLISEYLLPTDLNQLVDMMYSCRAVAHEELLQEMNSDVAIGRISTKKSFHQIMAMVWYNQHVEFYCTKVSIHLMTEQYLDIRTHVKEKNVDYYIFLKVPVTYMKAISLAYDVKEKNLGIIK